MLDEVLSFIAPHHCCGCYEIGAPLCTNCKYYITSEQNMFCVSCKHPTKRDWLCNSCKAPYKRIWVVGQNADILQRLIKEYKFGRAKSIYKVLGDLLLDILPELPPNLTVVPVPTASSHIRERGYDQTLLVARYISRRRNLKLETPIKRNNNLKQRGSNAKQRELQARNAFKVHKRLNSNGIYLLVDDVFTTGATVKYASKALLDAGAGEVWVATIAIQTLD